MRLIFKNSVRYLSIRNRLLLGFLLLCIPLLIFISLTLYQVKLALNHTDMIRKHDRPILDASIGFDETLLNTQRFVYQWLFLGNPETKVGYTNLRLDIQRRLAVMSELLAGYPYPEAITSRWESFRTKYPLIFKDQDKLLALPTHREQELSKESIATLQHSKLLIDKMIILLQELDREVSNLFFSDARQMVGILIVLKWLSYGALIIAVLLSALVPFFTARSIVPSLQEAIRMALDIADGKRLSFPEIRRQDEVGLLMQALEKMHDAIYDKETKLIENEEKTRQLFDNMVMTAQKYSNHSSQVSSGDLRERIQVEEGDMMGQLGLDLNTMTDSLATMTSHISDNSQKIVTIVNSITTAMGEQSSNMSEQASAIHQISASLEEIDKSSKKTIEKAQTLRDAAKETLVQGNKGKESVQQVITGMRTLREQVGSIEKTIVELSLQTLQISEITAAVTTLAQQSKMLALNASIEAAKAGESGKGFAVVANEVKTLAEQSERATTQVQKILDDIKHLADKAVLVTGEGTKTVDQGAALITATAEVINTLCDLIGSASVMSQQMEAAIRQEGIGIDQITTGMSEINSVSSSFEVGIKRIAEVIAQLGAVSAALKQDVSRYKT